MSVSEYHIQYGLLVFAIQLQFFKYAKKQNKLQEKYAFIMYEGICANVLEARGGLKVSF
jgi:hypothetical protein